MANNQGQAAAFESNYTHRLKRIHRFPPGLRAVGTRYIEPVFVAIGPYHRHLPHVQEMERLKPLAVDHFIHESGLEADVLRAAVGGKVGEARLLYGIPQPPPPVPGGGVPPPQGPPSLEDDAVLEEMLFIDACFLLQYIIIRMRAAAGNIGPPSLVHLFYSKRFLINNDIMLLENQIPFNVLSCLTDLYPVRVREFIAELATSFHDRRSSRPAGAFPGADYQPAHLLALLRFCMKEPVAVAGRGVRQGAAVAVAGRNIPDDVTVSFTAIGLEEIGINLKVSDRNRFADMAIKRRSPWPYLFKAIGRELVLPQLLLGAVSTNCLVNMAAWEVCTAESYADQDTLVCSYIRILAMLMYREDDVHQLRAEHLLEGQLSDRETLDLFTSLGKHLPMGERSARILASIEEYKLGMWLWIAVYKFFYLYAKKIVTVFAAMASLAGVFKLFELIVVKHQQALREVIFIPA